MTKSEMALKGFKVHTQCGMLGCSGCPYLDRMGKFDCVERLYADVLAMGDGLKPTEVVKPSYTYYQCGYCGTVVGAIVDGNTEHYNYCRNCGTKVKWDESI